MKSVVKKIAVLENDPEDRRSQDLAKNLQLELVTDRSASLEKVFDYVLCYEQEGLELRSLDETSPALLRVDFSEKSLSWRLRHSGKKQAIAKAVGINAKYIPSVIDATAGLGKDGFILAFLGCKVHLIEHSQILHALLVDGLARARCCDDGLMTEAASRITLSCGDSLECLTNLPPAQVIYLDPMFPKRKKSAKVKKNMRALQDFLSARQTNQQLLVLALTCAARRVVVKRPRYADFLDQIKPDFQLPGKASRYDVYLSPALK